MEQNNHILDDFLQQKVEEANFSYNEEYWVKMSALLDEEEKKKRFPFFWRGLSILLVLLTVGIAAYLVPKLSSKSKTTDVKQEIAMPAEQNSLASVVQDLPEQTLNQEKEVNSSHNTNETIAATETTKQATNDPQINDEATKNTKHTARHIDNTATDKQEPSNNQTNTNNDVSINTKTNTKPPVHTLKAKPMGLNKNKDLGQEDKGQSSTLTAAKERGIKKQSNTQIVGDNIVRSEHPGVNAEIKTSTSNNSINLSKEKTINASNQEVTIQGRKMNPIDTVTYQTRPMIDQSIYNPRYISSLSNYIPEKLDSVTIITYKPILETKITTAIPQQADSKEAFEKQGFEFMLLAGVNANKGFKGNASSPMSWGFSPYIGGGIEKQVSHKLTLSSHVGFTYFNGLNSDIKLSSTQYSFGLDSSTFAVAHKKLLQLYLPVSVYYEVLHNHFVMASLGISYGVDVSSKVTEQTMSNNTGYNSMNTKSATTVTKTEQGYSTGFNQFDVFAQIGYSYKLLNKLMLQCTYQQGFFDMTKNNYFKNNLNNTQSRFSIGLKYNFKRQ